MTKKKVLHVIGNLEIGGAEIVAMNYYRLIDREKYEFHYLVYSSKKGYYEDEVTALGGKVIHLNYSYSKLLSFSRKFLKLIKKEKYDIIHSHMLFNNGIVLKLANVANIPMRISHSHSTRNKVKETKILKLYEIVMRKIINENATHFLSCSTQAGEFLYGRKKYIKNGIMIPNGIDTQKFQFNEQKRKDIRKKHMIDDDVVLLGAVGHLESVKNHQYLLDLIYELRESKYNLLLVGDGSKYTELINKSKRLGIENQIILTGNVSNVEEYLSAMDLFLFPSLYEGFGISVIEAQANGLECLISDKIPDDVIVTELVHKLPIEEKNIEQWIEEVIKRTKNRVNNRAQYMQDVIKSGFDVKEVGNNLEKIYNSTYEKGE